MSGAVRPWGVLAEFAGPRELLRAAERVRDAGYRRWDCYTPFPVHGLDGAMGLRDTRLPWVVLGAGIAGVAAAVLLQWWTNAVSYPLLISGKPLWSLPAHIPIAFELTVLFSALTAVVALFAFNRLPQFYHPLFRARRFRGVTADRFFIAIEAHDPACAPEATERLLRSLGATHLEWVAEED